MRKIKSCKSLICCHCSCTQGSNPGNVPWHRWPEETAQAPITALGIEAAGWRSALSLPSPQHRAHRGGKMMEHVWCRTRWIYPTVVFSLHPRFYSSTMMCCFCSVPLTHISVEEHVSFSILIHSANLLRICACVSVSVWDVIVRMGRGCDNKSW